MSGSDWALVVSAEHASFDRPPEFQAAGVPEDVFSTHAAWDPGAREVATALAAAARAPLHLGAFTRLFVDLNRSPNSAEAVPCRAFGVEIPGNARLLPAELRARVATHHTPYWTAVERDVRLARRRANAVLHFSVHSFVEVYAGQHRAVDLGILFDPAQPWERTVADHLLAVFRRGGMDARENEPYDGRADALTTSLRKRLGPDWYAGVELEINQRHLPALSAIADLVTRAVLELTHLP